MGRSSGGGGRSSSNRAGGTSGGNTASTNGGGLSPAAENATLGLIRQTRSRGYITNSDFNGDLVDEINRDGRVSITVTRRNPVSDDNVYSNSVRITARINRNRFPLPT